MRGPGIWSTSGTDIGGDEDLLLPAAEALDDVGTMGNRQLCCQDGNLVSILAHGHCQPVGAPPCLGEAG